MAELEEMWFSGGGGSEEQAVVKDRPLGGASLLHVPLGMKRISK